jgi:hypothetical protein
MSTPATNNDAAGCLAAIIVLPLMLWCFWPSGCFGGDSPQDEIQRQVDQDRRVRSAEAEAARRSRGEWTRQEYISAAQDHVTPFLASPRSANHPWFSTEGFRVGRTGDTVSVAGFVDARNAFNAEVRVHYTIWGRISGTTWTTTRLEMSGRQVYP